MQEHLIFAGETISDYRIDEHTKLVGRQGIAAARRILEMAGKETVSQAA